MSAIEVLEREHRLISRVVALLPALRQDLEAGVVDESALSGVADFFSAFTDGCHHAKEEDLLFPMLQQRGVSSRGCPVGTLKLEHQQGRNIVKAIRVAVEKYKQGDAGATKRISDAVAEAEKLYTDHIWREDYLLFPMSHKVLLDADQETLAKEFALVQVRFDAAFQNKYETLVEGLERRLQSAASRQSSEVTRVPSCEEGTARVQQRVQA